MLAAPVQEALLRNNCKPPTYLGPVSDITLQTDEAGRRLANVLFYVKTELSFFLEWNFN